MLERIVDYYLKKRRIARNNKLIRKGILKVGQNSDISNLEISVATDLIRDSLNVVIGDDTILNCKIVIYNSEAKIIIGNRVYIGPQTTLFCNCGITIEDDILFSWGITVIDTNAHPIKFEDRKMDVLNWKKGIKNWTNIKSAPVIIRSGAWIGFNSIITKGVIVENEAIISCGTVVIKNVPAHSIVGGNPAVEIKKNRE